MTKKINKRKFKIKTPGQDRDFETLVKNRRFQRYEEVKPQEEDAPANAVAHGGVDMAPNARGARVFVKRRRLDGRTKEYRETVARIKARQQKVTERQVKAKLAQFGVQTNPFVREDITMDNKYLTTKEGSIEAAVMTSLGTEVETVKDTRPILHLPEKKYLKTKDGTLEERALAALANLEEKKDEDENGDEKGATKVRVTRKRVKHEIGAKDEKDDDGEGMDPVGKGDKDIDNDGDSDESDKYLIKRRKAISKSLKDRAKDEDWKMGYGKKKKKVEAREIGTDEYRKELEAATPGETVEDDVTVKKPQAKVFNAKEKAMEKMKNRLATKIDDSYIADLTHGDDDEPEVKTEVEEEGPKVTKLKPSLKGMATKQKRLTKAFAASAKKRAKEKSNREVGEPLIKDEVEPKKPELVDTVKQVMERGEYNVPPLKDKTAQASPKRSVSADNAAQTVMDTINKIAKTSKAAKVHGQTVDQTTAIAIQKVMKALTDKNAKKMEETINKDAEGFMGMAKFSLEQIK